MLTKWCRWSYRDFMIKTRWLPQFAPYHDIWAAMRDFTEARDSMTPDEIWLVEHAPVYTLGQAGKPEHVLNSGAIPVVACDRGGQVTYHGPGQVTAYCLLSLRRYHLFVKEYVALLESVLVTLLHDLGLSGACTRAGAPGVYVPLVASPVADHPRASEHGAAASTTLLRAPRAGADDPFRGLAKIAALGIKVRNGCTYHGLALNVDMDLTPYAGINPCGYQGVPTTDLKSCGITLSVQEAGDLLSERLVAAIIDYGQHKAQEAQDHDDRHSTAAY